MEIKKVLEFARRMLSIDIVINGWLNFGDDDLYDPKQRMTILFWESSKNKDNLFSFQLALNNEEGSFTDLMIHFDKNDVARIDEKPFQGVLPDKFVGHSAFGFVGSWKDVIDKVIELDRIMYPHEETEKPKEAQAKSEQKFYPDSYLRAHGFSSI